MPSKTKSRAGRKPKSASAKQSNVMSVRFTDAEMEALRAECDRRSQEGPLVTPAGLVHWFTVDALAREE